MSAKDALERFYKKEADKLARESEPRRRNGKPEIELVQKPCKGWFRRNGWAMFIIDSKAEWNSQRGAFVQRSDILPGFSDSVGCAPDGTAAFVEFKAPDRRGTLKEHQREFLIDKINKGCFAVCVDSVKCLEEIWIRFEAARKFGRAAGIQCLLNHLPKQAVRSCKNPTTLDEPALPFE